MVDATLATWSTVRWQHSPHHAVGRQKLRPESTGTWGKIPAREAPLPQPAYLPAQAQRAAKGVVSVRFRCCVHGSCHVRVQRFARGVGCFCVVPTAPPKCSFWFKIQFQSPPSLSSPKAPPPMSFAKLRYIFRHWGGGQILSFRQLGLGGSIWLPRSVIRPCIFISANFRPTNLHPTHPEAKSPRNLSIFKTPLKRLQQQKKIVKSSSASQVTSKFNVYFAKSVGNSCCCRKNIFK